jgi:hypothetical protein
MKKAITALQGDLEKTVYRTTNWALYNEALKNRGSLRFWFDKVLYWRAKPSGKPGAPHKYSNAAIQFC